MAAFSFQQYPFYLESHFLQNTSPKMPYFLEQEGMNASFFTQDPSDSLPNLVIAAATHESSCLGTGTDAFISENHVDCSNEASVTEKQQTDSISSSLVTEVPQQNSPMDKKRQNRDGSYLNSAESKEAQEQGKGKKRKKCNSSMEETEKKQKTHRKNNKKVSEEEPPAGYIHVRARRGQATDSHSLAERVRRLRINERMKLLQGLVPGCDKVTGKALMLDEIINYVQSLQNQVEFLSMKLASISPVYHDFGADLHADLSKSEKLSISQPLPAVQQSNHNQPTPISDSTKAVFPTTNNYPLLDSSAAAFLQGERPHAFSQDTTNLVWTVEDQRECFINQAGYSSLCSFH
ncbi:hypothetical protein AAC387_Pa08g2287 [Persea americana]